MIPIRTHQSPRVASRTRAHRGAAALVAAVSALSLAACSGAVSDSPSTSSSASSATSASSASGPTPPGVTAAAANVAKYSAAPTALGVSDPLPAAPDTGKTVVFLQCEVPQCKDGGDGFRDAAAAVGWTVKTASWKTTDPTTLIDQMQQALQLDPKPYAVSISGLPEAIWSSQVDAYAKAGVLLIPWSAGPVTLDDTVVAQILAPEDIQLQGKLLADFVITDSGGTANVLVQNVPQYPSIDEEASGFNDEITASCPDCKVTKLDITGTQVASGGVTPAIVSALQRDPSIDYLASADIALAAGLPAALQAAGRGDVKVVGGAATPIDEQDVRDGKDAAVMKNDLVYAGWLMIDVLVRHAAGLPTEPNGGGMPQQILTKDTIAPADSTDLVPANYPDLFKAAWLVS